MEALADDEEVAEQMLRRDRGGDSRPRRRMSDWSPAVEILTGILDRVGELTQAVAALGGAKPSKLPRAPYPVTAYDRVRQRRRADKHRSVVARVLTREGDKPTG